jgi:hypothetical protein
MGLSKVFYAKMADFCSFFGNRRPCMLAPSISRTGKDRRMADQPSGFGAARHENVF